MSPSARCPLPTSPRLFPGPLLPGPLRLRPLVGVPLLAGLALLGVGSPARAGLAAVPARAGLAAEPTPVVLPDSGYTLRLLELPTGGPGTGLAINEHGEVAGSVSPADGDWSPVIWDAAGHPRELPTPGAEAGLALTLDDRGRAAGWVIVDGDSLAVRWSGGRMQVAGPAEDSSAQLINGAGQVAGDLRSWHPLPFLFAPGRSAAPILPQAAVGAVSWSAIALDDAGNLYTNAYQVWPGMEDPPPGTIWRLSPGGHEVDVLAGVRRMGIVPESVGSAGVSETGVVAAVVQDRTWPRTNRVVVLPPGRDPLVLASSVESGYGAASPSVVVNDRGLVIGADARYLPSCYDGAWPSYQLVAWDPALGRRELAGTGAGCGQLPVDLNDAGEMIGHLNPATGVRSAFVWDAERGYRALAGAVSVTAINESGSVLGWVDDGAGGSRPAVWDPPEGHAIVSAPAVADTWVTSASGRALGSAPSLTAGGGAQALLRFSVPSAPPGRRLVAASLRLTVTSQAGAGTALPLELRPVTSAWSQSSTWATRPVVDRRRLGWVGAVAAGEALSVRIDPAQVTAGSTLDVAVVGTSPDVLKLASREAVDPTARPGLELVYR